MKKFILGIVAAATLLSASTIVPGATAAERPTLKEDSTLVLAKDGSYIFGTGGSITASDLAKHFEGSVTVKNPGGDIAAEDKYVPSGSTVSTDGGSIGVLIPGDANKDGTINLVDATTMLKTIAKWDVDIHEPAADFDADNSINLADVTTILKYLAKWDVRLGNMKVIVDETPQIAANEDETMLLWFDHSTEKLNQGVTIPTDKTTYEIYAAKNEIEDAVMYVSPDKDYEDLHVSVTDFVNSYGDTVESEAFAFYYVKMGDYGYLPDALMPDESAYKTEVKANKSQGYLIKAKTTDNTETGLYEATISLRSGGAEVKRAKIYLNVWDFTLDDRDACDTAFGLGKGSVISNHGMTGATIEEQGEIFRNYYDFLLENRINGFTLPYDITNEKGQEYMDDPRVHSFVIAGHGYGGGMNRTDEQISEYYEILSKNPEWLEKGYFYYIDEPLPDDRLPTNKEAYYSIGEKYELIQSQFPGGWQMIPLETCHGYQLTDDFYNVTKGTVQVYCPKSYAFTPEKYRNTPGAQVFLEPDDTAKHGTFEEVIDSWVADGTIKKLWWYFSCSTVDPYPNYNAESEGILPRVSGWQQYMYDVEGILYYATQEYNANIFRDIEYKGIGIYGDGILLYPGFKYPGQTKANQTLDGPIGSIRIEYIRDGIEDYMYLTMAERIIGEEKTDEILNKVTRDMLDYTTDTDVLLAARAELAEAIMTAQTE